MEALSSNFKNISLSDKQLLYIDGMNMLNRCFINRSKDIPDHWDLEHPYKKIEKFVKAAKKSNFEIKVFLDCDNPSDEALEKWMSRREKELVEGVKTMPTKAGFLLGNMLSKCGVEVHFPYECDTDDTIASFAQNDGASILSLDRDFFRYQERQFQVYSDFFYEKGALKLEPSVHKTPKSGTLPRKIISPPPKTYLKNPRVLTLSTQDGWRMGCPKVLGNPYLALRPLRQSLYSRLKISHPIKEIILYWSSWGEEEGKPQWDITKVELMGDLISF